MKFAFYAIVSLSFLLSSLCQQIAAQRSGGNCSVFNYVNEPPEELRCNPYLDLNRDTVILKCSMVGPTLPEGTDIKIEWFRTLESSGVTENLSNGDQDVLNVEVDSLDAITSDAVMPTSLLTIHDAIANDVAGRYWCTGVITVDTPMVSHQQFRSVESNATIIRSPEELEGGEPCETSIQTSLSSECVSFLAVLPPPLVPPSTGDDVRVATVSTRLVSGSELDEDQSVTETEMPILSSTVIIILAAVGGSLCLVIHVLLVLVSCLFIKSRRKKQVRRGIPDYRKTSSASTTSLIPSSQVPKYLPSPEGPPKSLPSPNGSIFKPLPPVPPNKPPVLNRSTLPSRLTHKVSLSALVETHESDSKEYAPVQIRNGKPRAATFAGELHSNFISIAREEDQKYKSLNRYTMNNEPEPHYEDLRLSSGGWEDEEEEEEEEGREEDTTYSTASAARNEVGDLTSPPTIVATAESQTMEIKPQPSVAKSTIQSMPLDFNILGHTAEVTIPQVLRAKSPMLTVKNVPLVRQSVDGEYVLPNEAYEGGLLSPTREEDLPDYIDIA